MFEVDIHGIIAAPPVYDGDSGTYVIAVKPGRTTRKGREPLHFLVTHERKGFGHAAAKADYPVGAAVVVSGQLSMLEEPFDGPAGPSPWAVSADDFIASDTGGRHQYARARVEGTLREDPELRPRGDGQVVNFVVRAFTELHPDQAITLHCSYAADDASHVADSFSQGYRINLVADLGEYRFVKDGRDRVWLDGHVTRWYHGQDKAPVAPSTPPRRQGGVEVVRRGRGA